MNLLKKLKQLVYSACLYFTVAEFIILIAAAAFSQTSPESGGEVGKFLSLSSASLVLLGAFIMSAINFVWKLEYSTPVKVLIHFICSFAAFAILFIIIPGIYGDTSQIIVRCAVFAALYFIIAFIIMIINSIIQNKRANKQEYENKFDKQ